MPQPLSGPQFQAVREAIGFSRRQYLEQFHAWVTKNYPAVGKGRMITTENGLYLMEDRPDHVKAIYVRALESIVGTREVERLITQVQKPNTPDGKAPGHQND